VVDVSSPHAVAQTSHVIKVLDEIEAGAIPQVLVLNKIDRLPDGGQGDAGAARSRAVGEPGREIHAPAVGISALTGAGIDGLLEAIDKALPFDTVVETRFRLPVSDGQRIALLHAAGRVLEARYDEEYAEFRVEAPQSLVRRLEEFIVS
jgi:GTP-binding protein HflX